MSNTQYVFMRRADVPTRALLQQTIDSIGFDLLLYPEFDLLVSNGFCPCTLEGVEDVGFELHREPIESLREDQSLRDMAQDRDFCLTMTWGGRMQDCTVALIVCAALAKLCGATVSYEGEQPQGFEALVDEARSALSWD